MDEARYRVALRIAKATFRRLGRRSIDGREPHDIAMQSLDREPWQPRRVWFDCIDAYRKERGRRGRRKGMRLVGLRDDLAAKPVEWFELGLVLKGRTEVLVCELLAAGYQKQEVAAVVGVTPTRIGQVINAIRKRNLDPDARLPQRKEG